MNATQRLAKGIAAAIRMADYETSTRGFQPLRKSRIVSGPINMAQLARSVAKINKVSVPNVVDDDLRKSLGAFKTLQKNGGSDEMRRHFSATRETTPVHAYSGNFAKGSAMAAIRTDLTKPPQSMNGTWVEAQVYTGPDGDNFHDEDVATIKPEIVASNRQDVDVRGLPATYNATLNDPTVDAIKQIHMTPPLNYLG